MPSRSKIELPPRAERSRIPADQSSVADRAVNQIAGMISFLLLLMLLSTSPHCEVSLCFCLTDIIQALLCLFYLNFLRMYNLL